MYKRMHRYTLLIIILTCLLSTPVHAIYQSLAYYPRFLNGLDLSSSTEGRARLTARLTQEHVTSSELIRVFAGAFPGLAPWLSSTKEDTPGSRHTLKMLDLVDEQYERWNFQPLQGVRNLKALFRLQTVLADIGAHAAIQNHKAEFTTPIMKRVMEQLDYSLEEQQLALSLTAFDVFETLSTLTPTQAFEKYKTVAARHSLDVAVYLKLQTFISTLKRAAISEHLVTREEGHLKAKDIRLSQLEALTRR